MKCPKCGYLSFDYNQVCPKCNKDISTDQGKLNLPSFRPEPPSLLTALTGEHEESDVDLRIDSRSRMESHDDEDIDLEDSVIMETEDFSDDEGEDFGEEEEEEEISLDMDDISNEGYESEEIAAAEPALKGEKLAIDFDEEAVDDSEAAAAVDMEVDALSLDAEDAGEDEEQEGISINLEDLDIDLDLEKSDN